MDWASELVERHPTRPFKQVWCDLLLAPLRRPDVAERGLEAQEVDSEHLDRVSIAVDLDRPPPTVSGRSAQSSPGR